ncbi:MAG: tRNA (adenosine(37)-N6)-dimethylallyltransferase MiaA [Bacteroidales bacterium]|nr:tRNA (adenosine(37)-N6)-dimethylallyltransferase MiaA [Bacteroidales bacterium]
MSASRRRLLILLGPTAVGKTDYSITLARKHGSPVISCDARQIFRQMAIGTAVPSPEQLRAVPHHFIQTVPVDCAYTAGDYELEAVSLLERLFDEGHETLVMTGGSMFYIDAVCRGLDDLPDGDPVLRRELWDRLRTEGVAPLAEELHRLDPATYAVIDRSNSQRVIRALEVCLLTGRPFSSYKTGTVKRRSFTIEKIGLERPRAELYARIDARVGRMLEDGLVEEVRSLLPYRECQALQTVGYREIFDYLDGRTGLEEAADRIRVNTRHYAKRQLTWWRRDPDIRWIPVEG